MFSAFWRASTLWTRKRKQVSEEVSREKRKERNSNVHLNTLLPALNDMLALLHQILENIGFVELWKEEEEEGE